MAHETYIKEVVNKKTAILFIHGFLGSTEHFQRFISHIGEDSSIFNILLEGHGGSVLDFAHASMEKWKIQIKDMTEYICANYDNVYIVAHSMGTFFSMDEAIRHEDKVKAIFLLQSPLKIGVKPMAIVNTIKSFFNIFGDDEISMAYKTAHSVKLDFKIWEYVGWIKRYLELFKESKRSRTTIKNLNTKCFIFQSKKDELVSLKSLKYIPKKKNISVYVLEESAHFIYSKRDDEFLIKKFFDMTEEVRHD